MVLHALALINLTVLVDDADDAIRHFGDLVLLLFGLITELNHEATGNGDSVSHWENHELVLGNLENILNQDIFFFTNLEFRICFVLSNLTVVDEELRPLVTLLIENVLVVMEPLILL